MRSKMNSPAIASPIAAILVNMTKKISLRLIDQLLTDMSSFLIFHDPGEPQQPRADSEPHPLCGIRVDLEADRASLDPEVDDASPAGESRRLPNRQNRGASYGGQQTTDLILFRCADEQNVALTQVLIEFQAPHDERPTVDTLALHGVVDDGSERILADDA